jgi:hypothetical protein
MEGAVGLTGAKYVGEIAPRDGTLAGYLTGTAFLYALDPERFRVDFKTCEFVGIQPGTSINFVRTDVAPGMKAPADIMKARGLIVGSLGPVSSKGARLRLGLDLLGIPFKYISGYRSGGAAKLAIEEGEINFYGESSPSYFSIIEPGLERRPVSGVGLGVPPTWLVRGRLAPRSMACPFTIAGLAGHLTAEPALLGKSGQFDDGSEVCHEYCYFLSSQRLRSDCWSHPRPAGGPFRRQLRVHGHQ